MATNRLCYKFVNKLSFDISKMVYIKERNSINKKISNLLVLLYT